MNETSSSIVMGTVRYWPTWLWVQLTKVSSLTSWPPWFEKRQNWIAKIGAEFITHVSLVLSERERERDRERKRERQRQRDRDRDRQRDCLLLIAHLSVHLKQLVVSLPHLVGSWSQKVLLSCLTNCVLRPIKSLMDQGIWLFCIFASFCHCYNMTFQDHFNLLKLCGRTCLV